MSNQDLHFVPSDHKIADNFAYFFQYFKWVDILIAFFLICIIVGCIVFMKRLNNNGKITTIERNLAIGLGSLASVALLIGFIFFVVDMVQVKGHYEGKADVDKVITETKDGEKMYGFVTKKEKNGITYNVVMDKETFDKIKPEKGKTYDVDTGLIMYKKPVDNYSFFKVNKDEIK